MSSPVLRATVAVVVLVLVGVVTGGLGVLELSQPSSAPATTTIDYNATLPTVLNASIRSNPLSPATNLTDPTTLFANITTSISLSVSVRFWASQSLPVAGVVSSAGRLYSGTTPLWSMAVFSESRTLNFDSSARSYSFTTPVNRSFVASALNNTSATNSEFGVSPGSPTLVINASIDLDIGGVVAKNNSSVVLTFDYANGFSGVSTPSAYSAINVAYSLGTIKGELTTRDADPLPSHALEGALLLSAAAAAFVAAALVGWLYLPHPRPTPLQRFLSENAENVVRVLADARVAQRAVQLKDLAELVKLANLSGQPIFLFESPKEALLYVIQGDTTFACTVPPTEAPERVAS